MASSATVAARAYSSASISSRMASFWTSLDSLVPLLLLRKLFPDVVFREAERGDGSPGVLFRLSLQLFRRVREKAKEDRSA